MEARAGRLEALRTRDMPTIEKTIVHVPQPKALVKNEVIKVSEKVKSKLPVVAVWYTWRYKLPAWRTADVMAPGVVIGQAIGRLGCFAAGCCFGKPADVPWAVTFTDIYDFSKRWSSRSWQSIRSRGTAGMD